MRPGEETARTETVVVACRTIEDELRAAMEKSGRACPVRWLESGLHSVPRRLTAALQDTLDGLPARRALLALGSCGNALWGVRAGELELIFPRVDDCISLLLGGVPERLAVSRRCAAYFFTEGWLRGENNIWAEYQRMETLYGPELARELGEDMYGHYRTLGLLDCGVTPFPALEERTRVIADTLGLRQQRIPGTTTYLEQLLTGPWPAERFVRKPPGSVITPEDTELPPG